MILELNDKSCHRPICHTHDDSPACAGVAEKLLLTRRLLQRQMAGFEKLQGEIEALKVMIGGQK